MIELEEIYNNYFKDVYLFIYGLSKDKDLAEDLTSETFVKVMKSIENFKGNCDIKVWIFQIAKNSYYSYIRKQKDLINLDSVRERRADFDIEKFMLSSEESMKVHKIVHKLSEPYKEVFSLRVFGELSFKQIGSLFGKTENWACVTFHRARSKIIKEMRENK
ncbi:MAG: sigma-70 family RNA polymerase sigma factor [Clostridiales bacterium]|uniref:RNA polymerase sigma factor n=1 Tax=Clostridium sp. N3C TaxID=1776758 RepID=UPI00092DED12|nr:sigma-70 family RNA polymerase sigma factor [Clostridium sp. N3C]NLZ49764.1 sigma-70 family RNA polymerase sigma factor [Clostridiales bacterium]SCN24038.1 RNA polymerase sigma factor SigM [Clostridium sp. N3C]